MKALPKPEHERKKDALEDAIDLFQTNAQHMNSGPWYVAEHIAAEIFEKMQRGEMGGFEYAMRGWFAGDEMSIALLCRLAELHIFADKSMPDYLKCFVSGRLIEPTARPSTVDGKFAGFVPAKVKRARDAMITFREIMRLLI
jgi:hypothetical protein